MWFGHDPKKWHDVLSAKQPVSRSLSTDNWCVEPRAAHSVFPGHAGAVLDDFLLRHTLFKSTASVSLRNPLLETLAHRSTSLFLSWLRVPLRWHKSNSEQWWDSIYLCCICVRLCKYSHEDLNSALSGDRCVLSSWDLRQLRITAG